ncbi:hypothetical protein LRP49_15455 [Enterovibrio sp. ZSDZ35]|uniref:Lipoprotein n=1 Tax=Enterovibrio qingdaonensis TaxID=2899818 RepID=A0ABT5QPG0_9GAMM|nr:hypothetical protein [Enterovibrio sp. ZSDZ35]MDD1782568.1 hypothetical protein [Enterovibrio sp. ZSDZ35]
MYLTNCLKALFLPVIFTLTACGESVTFSPEQGDEKRYWVYAHTARDAEREPVTLMLSQSLVHYRVDQVGDTLKLHVTPEHLQLGVGSSGFSSIESPHGNDRIQQVFSSGFDLSLNGKSGELTDFKAKNTDQWQTFVAQGGQVLINGLQSTMNTPGFLQSIPVEEGSQIALPHFHGESATLTVQKVTEKSLFVTVSSQSEDDAKTQLYGQLEISRENGWFEKVLLVMNVPVEVFGATKMTQFALAMHPEEEPIGTFAEIFYNAYYDDERYWFDIPPLSEGKQAPVVLNLDDVLPYDRGMMYENHEGFQVAFATDLTEDTQIGKIVFRDASASSGGKPIDIALAFPLDQQFLDEQMNVSANVMPLGWSKQEAIKDIETISARVDYYDVSSKRHNVQWTQSEKQTFQLGDITLTATKVADTQNEYLLEYTDTEHSQLALDIGGMQGQISFLQPESLPQWFMPSAKQMFSYLGDPATTERTIAVKLSEAPTNVTFLVHSQSKDVSFSRDVVFVEKSLFLSSAEMPPMDVSPDYGYVVVESDIKKPSQNNTTFSFTGDLSLETESAQNAAVALPYEWENVCQFSIENAPEINGHKLVWKPQPMTNNDVAGAPSKIAKNSTAYQLMTPDGIRRYFYDLEVTTRLACEGKPSWGDVALTTSTFPWLIDVNTVEGFDKNQTLKQFVSRYRISDKSGQQLLPIDTHGNVFTVDDRPITEVLFDDTYIKMSGKISRAEYFKIEGEPLERTFVTTFPPLKKG